jgi:hypothetical protein
MPAKKAAKKAAATKEAPAVEPGVPAAKEAPVAKEAPAKKAANKTAKKDPAPKAATSAPKPSKEKDVAKAAYLNYMDRKSKGLPGDPVGDWLAAEKTEGS